MEKVGEELRLGFVDNPDYSVLEAFRYIVSGKDYTGRVEEVLRNPHYEPFLDKLQASLPSPFDINKNEATMLRDLVNEYVEVFVFFDETPKIVKKAIESADDKWSLPDIEQVKLGIEELTTFVEA